MPIRVEVDDSIDRNAPFKFADLGVQLLLNDVSLTFRLRQGQGLDQCFDPHAQLVGVLDVLFGGTRQLSAENQRPQSTSVLAQGAQGIGPRMTVNGSSSPLDNTVAAASTV